MKLRQSILGLAAALLSIGLIGVGISQSFDPLGGLNDAQKRALDEPFKGITTDGQVIGGLYPIAVTGITTAPARNAAEAFLAGLSAEQRARADGKPFFLFLHTLDTHGPRYQNNTATTWLDAGFDAQRDAYLRSWDALIHEPNLSFTDADQQRLVNLYDGGVAYADSTVGEVLAALEARVVRGRARALWCEVEHACRRVRLARLVRRIRDRLEKETPAH